MKLSRRILAVLLAVLMISASASFAAAAADEPTVAISTAQGKKGKSVEITVSIANNPGIVSMTLNLTYDAAALKLTGVADTGLMPGQMHTTTYTSPYTLTWANDTAPANITVNGTFAKLTFEILTDVVGEYPIMVSVPKDGILDFDVNNIDFRLDHGGITVLSDHTHKTVHYPAAAATCNAGGNIEYWYCAGCNTYFADANGNTKIANAATDKNPANHVGGTEVRGAQPAACSTPGYTGDTYCLGCGAKILSGSSIPATGNHADADNRWESDADGHWHTCGCGAEFDKAAHSGGTATCRDQGVCSVCGFAYLDKNPANHVGGTEVRGYAAATVGKEGYTGDTYCLGCNTVIERGTVIPKHTHQSGTAWCFDADNHWKVCECGEIMHKAAHTAGDWIIVQEATPGRNGEQQKKCTACGYVMESEAIPATGADLNEWYRFMEMLKNLKFTITAEASEGGTISHEGKTSVQYNTNITYSVTPEEGYAIKAVYVNGKNVGAANEYTFRNVRANQSISVEFVRTAWENPFVDIANDAKYMDAVRFVYENGLFKGISDHEFAPDTTMTRAMFVTVLGRLAGIDTASYTGVRFEDAAAGEWYAPYVEWAAENGIVLGYGNGTFGIDDKITIEQAAVILARYAKHTDEYKDSSIALDNYSDDDTVSDWALEAMKWAVANEVYTGDAGKLNPQEPASRALVAAMIYSYAKGFAGKN